jgi:lipopolysaccharide export system permease protein
LKIISRYILREHFGPFMFALTALTSLMLLNFISRQFGELVGKGLPWSVIGEFFLLSIPFTVALTVPMSVLVAVLYAYSRLAAENEVTALKANGVSPWRLVTPSLAGGLVMSILLLAFNDQVLPRANHRLKTLQDDISQTKPALLLKEQVINSIVEGKFYLKAGKIVNDPVSARLKEVVIYDLTDTQRRRTIYADTARLSFASNRVDLDMDLYNGEMQEVSTDKPSQLDRLFYKHDRIKIKDVGKDFKPTTTNDNSKGDREMGICEMQQRLWKAEAQKAAADKDLEDAKHAREALLAMPTRVKTLEPHGLGWAYCTLVSKLIPQVKQAQAAEVRGASLHRRQEPVTQDTSTKKQDTSAAKKQDTSAAKKQDTGAAAKKLDTSAARKPDTSAARKQDSIAKAKPAPTAVTPGLAPVTPNVLPAPQVVQQMPHNQLDTMKSQAQIAAEAAALVMHGAKSGAAAAAAAGPPMDPRVQVATMQVTLAQRARDRFEIEINKKFSLAAACLIFCIVAPPIALRFPRGGVGLVIGVSLFVFALYYVGLIGGEALANKGLVPPFWAMWGTNLIMTLVGLVMLFRMGRDAGSARGGGIREWLDERQLLREERRAAALASAA